MFCLLSCDTASVGGAAAFIVAMSVVKRRRIWNKQSCCFYVSSENVRKKPAAFTVLSGFGIAHATGVQSSCPSGLPASDHDNIETKDALVRMGPSTVRNVLEAQGRYSRKRHKEHAYENSKGQKNKIRKWAKVLGINLGKQVCDISGESNMKWWHKSRHELTDEIVAAVENAK